MKVANRSRFTQLALACLFLILLSAHSLSAQTYTSLYHFSGPDGIDPNGGLVFDSAGNLYGTTAYGGTCEFTSGCGVVFELSPTSSGDWTQSVLHTFGGVYGETPESGVVFDSKGNLYGTAQYGGANNAGVVYELIRGASGWSEKVLYNFTGLADGGHPAYAVILDQAGNVYGTTTTGGSAKEGVLFQLSPSGSGWTYNVIVNLNHKFGTGSSPLAMDANGNLFGTAANGIADQNKAKGTIYELSPSGGSWNLSIPYVFMHIYDTGTEPLYGVAFDGAGNIYGTTGGVVLLAEAGVVYELSANFQQETILDRLQWQIFYGIRNSFMGPIVLDSLGNAYAAVYNQDQGAVQTYDGFVVRVGPSGTEQYTFPPLLPAQKIYPMGSLAIDAQGNAYGVTRRVFGAGGGVFKITF